MMNNILYGLESVATVEMFEELNRLEKAYEYAESAELKAKHEGILEDTEGYLTDIGELVLENTHIAKKALTDYAERIWSDVHDCIEMQMYCAQKAAEQAGYKIPYNYHDYEDDITEMLLREWGIWEYLE